MTEQHTGSATRQKLLVWLSFTGILFSYALLILPTVERLGIGWDEATDMVIAEAYQSPQGMLLGSSWDPSQTRLPMFTVAILFHLLGENNLHTARFTSVLIGGLTLLGVFIYGKERFDTATGLLAAGLLAINPFFLAFARQAFTESDIFLACTLIWLLVSLSHLQEKPSLGWAVLSGILLSLSISSKATAIIILPAACLSFLLNQIFPQKSDARHGFNNSNLVSARSVLLWTAWAISFLLVGVLISRRLNIGYQPGIVHLANYSLVFLGWLLMLVWAVRYRNFTAPPVALAVYLAGWSLFTFVIFPPEHLANSDIIAELISRADKEMTFSPAFLVELLALHTFTIFFKSTPVLGLGLLGGSFLGLTQWKRRELTLPLLVVMAYFSFLLLLPLGQTFYTIPILSILSLLAADQLMRLFQKRRAISLVLVFIGLTWWGVEMKQCYPDYHLNGYQWLGARPFSGRSSVGYRSIVFTPADGVQQSVEWLNVHAKSGQTALLYVEPWHIVKVMAPDPAYELTDGRTASLSSKADYIVIHIGSVIWQGAGDDSPQGSIYRYPFDVDTMQREYEKVFSVQRAFGLEMASIWRKK